MVGGLVCDRLGHLLIYLTGPLILIEVATETGLRRRPPAVARMRTRARVDVEIWRATAVPFPIAMATLFAIGAWAHSRCPPRLGVGGLGPPAAEPRPRPPHTAGRSSPGFLRQALRHVPGDVPVASISPCSPFHLKQDWDDNRDDSCTGSWSYGCSSRPSSLRDRASQAASGAAHGGWEAGLSPRRAGPRSTPRCSRLRDAVSVVTRRALPEAWIEGDPSR